MRGLGTWVESTASCQAGDWPAGLRERPYAAFPTAGCWLGLDHELWSTRGRSPIWIRFKSGTWGRSERVGEPLRPWLNADPPRAYPPDGEVQVPVLLAVGVERERVVEDAVRQLRDLREMLSGLPPLGGETPAEP